MITNAYERYKAQYKKAKETLDLLEVKKTEINFGLETDSINAALHKELRTVNLEIKITLNELEQVESNMQACEIQFKST
ncbi:hypothetical protein [Flavobacterium sp. ACAM 123]|jgi:hypothetical protein|uniref:hypothetical protein n=1 Tax=Flavobacterium sp. ACAM 123 TaxID=1189620 RepID=UPI0002E81D3B|nr:hypothetical protein [Flavobacterium sp. ACAM 123]